MTSNLSCIGFAIADPTELESLVADLFPLAQPLGNAGGVEIRRWQDPSGARLVLGRTGNDVVDFLPSFDGRPGVDLIDCRAVNEDVIVGIVVDESGEQTTQMAFELEQRRALRPGQLWSGAAAVTAFASNPEFFDSDDDFARSPRSQLDPNADPDEPAPLHFVELGWPWPARMAVESFFPWGTFGEDDADAVARSRLNGIVHSAGVRRNVRTGRAFLAARVRCLGFEADLVTEWDEGEPPAPGSIVATDAFFVASIDALEFDDKSRPRRRLSPLRR